MNGAVDHNHISPVTNLNTLAPDIATAIFDDTLPEDITLFDMTIDPPALWKEQRERISVHFLFPPSAHV